MEEPLTNLQTSDTPVSSGSKERLVGQVIADKYKITDLIGAGALAKVYSATHLELNEAVAVKVLLQDTDTESALRFRKEAKTLTGLRHPNIVCVRDYGEHDHRPYLVMDLAQGKSLEWMLDQHGALSDQASAAIFMQVCEGVQYAHKQGILHRDLKPANIMIGGNEEEGFKVQVVDFGLAKDFSTDGKSIAKMTQTGNILGTPAYMSPEQCTGQDLDQRSDIYSLGCVMYEAVSAKKAFDSNTLFDCMFKHLNEIPTRLRKLDPPVNSTLEPVIFKCLAKQADGRYFNLEELKSDLQTIWEGKQLASLIPTRKSYIRPRLMAATIDGICIWLLYAVSAFAVVTWFALLNNNKEVLQQAQQIFKSAFTVAGLPFFVIIFLDAITSIALPVISLSTVHALMYSTPPDGILYVSFGGALISWLYHAISESSILQATPGKRVLGLMLVDSGFRRPNFLQVSIRHFLKVLSVILVVDLIRALWMNFTVKKGFRQAWQSTMQQPVHDKLSGCLIIKRPDRKK